MLVGQIDTMGHPHSAGLRVEARFHRADQGPLRIYGDGRRRPEQGHPFRAERHRPVGAEISQMTPPLLLLKTFIKY